MIKSLSILTRKRALSPEAFRTVWENEHAPLVRAVPQVRRYVLSFIVEEPTRAHVPIHDLRIDAIAELWYDDLASMREAAASEAMQKVLQNGALYLEAIKTIITEEITII
jgi:uncharacterized protein (TIGR02118 family)